MNQEPFWSRCLEPVCSHVPRDAELRPLPVSPPIRSDFPSPLRPRGLWFCPVPDMTHTVIGLPDQKATVISKKHLPRGTCVSHNTLYLRIKAKSSSVGAPDAREQRGKVSSFRPPSARPSDRILRVWVPVLTSFRDAHGGVFHFCTEALCHLYVATILRWAPGTRRGATRSEHGPADQPLQRQKQAVESMTARRIGPHVSPQTMLADFPARKGAC